ncbi:hypothetical protein GLAREA_04538 [Glarea lozoyensis ATCC 20868]|uniref:Myb-like domain-containing protein n=2 Tax=Glarea lozoyensis TaxID=101852 RepID=S3CMN6_GLAL2|nr:uncharacterized protein GLAREA_04538 [Glarea lozoyensis ATCC 20868]EHL00388.1 hypothetical protein M7I_3670 [Glarea lozoyensis 74030]EPE27747.1 hypothetical protein GLAREA_04538 [Glarea lozoyensis ATCC 20868]
MSNPPRSLSLSPLPEFEPEPAPSPAKTPAGKWQHDARSGPRKVLAAGKGRQPYWTAEELRYLIETVVPKKEKEFLSWKEAAALMQEQFPDRRTFTAVTLTNQYGRLKKNPVDTAMSRPVVKPKVKQRPGRPRKNGGTGLGGQEEGVDGGVDGGAGGEVVVKMEEEDGVNIPEKKLLSDMTSKEIREKVFYLLERAQERYQAASSETPTSLEDPGCAIKIEDMD